MLGKVIHYCMDRERERRERGERERERERERKRERGKWSVKTPCTTSQKVKKSSKLLFFVHKFRQI